MDRRKFIKRAFASLASLALAVSMVGTTGFVSNAADTTTRPSKWDLRALGTVTNVKSQGYLGTCWAFACTAAAETNILNELGMTADEFKATYGYDMDLSEHHLAWFAYTPLNSELEPTQAGEGIYYTSLDYSTDVSSARMDGGVMFLASKAYASAVGPVFESEYPYINEEGAIVFKTKDGDRVSSTDYAAMIAEGAVPYYQDTEGDWSIDESERFGTAMMMDDSCILESPAHYKDNGQYYYFEEGTNEIKDALLEGNAVTIAYLADMAMANDNSGNGKYMNYNNYSYYVYDDNPGANHAVTIVGYDDNYSRYNFNSNHMPPADGAWIVKNSWGSADQTYPNNGDFGTDGSGYFYLSYYDKSVIMPTVYTFDYVDPTNMMLNQYDYLYSAETHAFVDSDKLSEANVFTTDSKPEKLEYVTIDTNAASVATVEIYQLNNGATNPTDGKLVYTDTVTEEFEGYHRLDVNSNVVIPANTKYSVVVTEIAPVDLTGEGAENYYCSNIYYGLNYDAVSEIYEETGYVMDSYVKAVVNPGESYFYTDGIWYDLSDYITNVLDNNMIYVSEYGSEMPGYYFDYDNFPIKCYSRVQK